MSQEPQMSMVEEFLQLAKEMGFIPERPPRYIHMDDVKESRKRLELSANRLGGYLKFLFKESKMDKVRLGKIIEDFAWMHNFIRDVLEYADYCFYQFERPVAEPHYVEREKVLREELVKAQDDLESAVLFMQWYGITPEKFLEYKRYGPKRLKRIIEREVNQEHFIGVFFDEEKQAGYLAYQEIKVFRQPIPEMFQREFDETTMVYKGLPIKRSYF
jgi:hypothetical protein